MRSLRSLLALGLLAGSASVLLPSAASAVSASPDLGAVTISKDVSRVHLGADGKDVPVDARTVTLHVGQTHALRSRQPILVSWTGAHPTSGLVFDPNSPEARQQEYPFVLLECRGTDSQTAPAGQRLAPETCWTGTSRERDLADRSTGFGPWRVDRYETPANRKASVGLPDPFPSQCDKSFAKAERWTHFVSVTGIDYGADGGSCPAVPPESTVVSNSSQPSNNTYAATHLDGTGNSKFTTWTAEDNASLGCGPKVRCALVAVPVMGISCDVTAASLPPADRPTAGKQADAAAKACQGTGKYEPGEPRIGGSEDLAVSGAEWFSASNWRNRITVPLDFAPLNNVCDLVGAKAGVDVYGSELATQLTAQWRPTFCLTKGKTPFKHVQVGEPQAANLLKAGNIQGAFLSDAPEGGFTVPTVQAPVAMTGFAVAYSMDDENKEPYRHLKLTPRLLAKLLTESYPGIQAVKSEYAALARNPLNISLDPEFQALNPEVRDGVPDSPAASTLFTLSSDSDVVAAVTRYINADPAARVWMLGIPDPWGMTVNPSYTTNPHRKGHLTLPVRNWPLRDTFEPKDYYNSGNNVCLQSAPAPLLPLIAAPTARMANITLALQFASSGSQLVCQTVADKGADGAKLVAEGRQPPGLRFVIGSTSLGDAARYSLDTAALQSYVSPDAAEKFTSATGRVFVAPTDGGLAAAARLFEPDDATGTWVYPYDKQVTTASAANAYPGAMMLTVAVPTKGLDATAATGLSELLAFAAGPGQKTGLDIGEVPPGYLPLTKANGLSTQLAFTSKAVALVRAQKGGTLNPSGAAVASQGSAPASPSAAAPTSAPAGPTGIAPLPVLSSAPSTIPVANAAPVVASPPSTVANVVAGITGAVRSAFASALFPALFLVALISTGTAVAMRRMTPSDPSA